MRHVLILAILAAVMSPLPLAAGPDASFIYMQKRHLRLLYEKGRYFDCISETRLLMTCAGESKKVDDYGYFIAACYYLGGQYGSAVRSTGEPAGFRSTLLLSQSYREAGMFAKGLAALEKEKYKGLSSADRYELFIRRSELMLYDYRYEEILAETRRARNLVGDRDALESFASDMEGYRDIKTRSRVLAASLSAVLPGAGQVYSGRCGQGLLSFFSVALPAAASVFFYRRGGREMSRAMLFFSAVFYTGNIYGAVRSAEYAGSAANAGFRDRLLRRHVPAYDPAGEQLKRRVFE